MHYSLRSITAKAQLEGDEWCGQLSDNCVKLFPKKVSHRKSRLAVGSSSGQVVAFQHVKQDWTTEWLQTIRNIQKLPEGERGVKSLELCTTSKQKKKNSVAVKDRVLFTDSRFLRCVSKNNKMKLEFPNLWREYGQIIRAFGDQNSLLISSIKDTPDGKTMRYLRRLEIQKPSLWSGLIKKELPRTIEKEVAFVYSDINCCVYDTDKQALVFASSGGVYLTDEKLRNVSIVAHSAPLSSVKIFDIRKERFASFSIKPKADSIVGSSAPPTLFPYLSTISAGKESNELVLNTFFTNNQSQIDQIVQTKTIPGSFGCGDIYQDGKRVIFCGYKGGYELFEENLNGAFEKIEESMSNALMIESPNACEFGEFLDDRMHVGVGEFVISTPSGGIISVSPLLNQRPALKNTPASPIVQRTALISNNQLASTQATSFQLQVAQGRGSALSSKERLLTVAAIESMTTTAAIASAGAAALQVQQAKSGLQVNDELQVKQTAATTASVVENKGNTKRSESQGNFKDAEKVNDQETSKQIFKARGKRRNTSQSIDISQEHQSALEIRSPLKSQNLPVDHQQKSDHKMELQADTVQQVDSLSKNKQEQSKGLSKQVDTTLIQPISQPPLPHTKLKKADLFIREDKKEQQPEFSNIVIPSYSTTNAISEQKQPQLPQQFQLQRPKTASMLREEEEMLELEMDFKQTVNSLKSTQLQQSSYENQQFSLPFNSQPQQNRIDSRFSKQRPSTAQALKTRVVDRSINETPARDMPTTTSNNYTLQVEESNNRYTPQRPVSARASEGDKLGFGNQPNSKISLNQTNKANIIASSRQWIDPDDLIISGNARVINNQQEKDMIYERSSTTSDRSYTTNDAGWQQPSSMSSRGDKKSIQQLPEKMQNNDYLWDTREESRITKQNIQRSGEDREQQQMKQQLKEQQQQKQQQEQQQQEQQLKKQMQYQKQQQYQEQIKVEQKIDSSEDELEAKMLERSNWRMFESEEEKLVHAPSALSQAYEKKSRDRQWIALNEEKKYEEGKQRNRTAVSEHRDSSFIVIEKRVNPVVVITPESSTQQSSTKDNWSPQKERQQQAVSSQLKPHFYDQSPTKRLRSNTGLGTYGQVVTYSNDICQEEKKFAERDSEIKHSDINGVFGNGGSEGRKKFLEQLSNGGYNTSIKGDSYLLVSQRQNTTDNRDDRKEENKSQVIINPVQPTAGNKRQDSGSGIGSGSGSSRSINSYKPIVKLNGWLERKDSSDDGKQTNKANNVDYIFENQEQRKGVVWSDDEQAEKHYSPQPLIQQPYFAGHIKKKSKFDYSSLLYNTSLEGSGGDGGNENAKGQGQIFKENNSKSSMKHPHDNAKGDEQRLNSCQIAKQVTFQTNAKMSGLIGRANTNSYAVKLPYFLSDGSQMMQPQQSVKDASQPQIRNLQVYEPMKSSISFISNAEGKQSSQQLISKQKRTQKINQDQGYQAFLRAIGGGKKHEGSFLFEDQFCEWYEGEDSKVVPQTDVKQKKRKISGLEMEINELGREVDISKEETLLRLRDELRNDISLLEKEVESLSKLAHSTFDVSLEEESQQEERREDVITFVVSSGVPVSSLIVEVFSQTGLAIQGCNDCESLVDQKVEEEDDKEKKKVYYLQKEQRESGSSWLQALRVVIGVSEPTISAEIIITAILESNEIGRACEIRKTLSLQDFLKSTEDSKMRNEGHILNIPQTIQQVVASALLRKGRQEILGSSRDGLSESRKTIEMSSANRMGVCSVICESAVLAWKLFEMTQIRGNVMSGFEVTFNQECLRREIAEIGEEVQEISAKQIRRKCEECLREVVISEGSSNLLARRLRKLLAEGKWPSMDKEEEDGDSSNKPLYPKAHLRKLVRIFLETFKQKSVSLKNDMQKLVDKLDVKAIVKILAETNK